MAAAIGLEKAALRALVKADLRKFTPDLMQLESACPPSRWSSAALPKGPTERSGGCAADAERGIQRRSVRAGKAIQTRVLDAGLLRAAARVGCYAHCDKLREVHTDRLLAALLNDDAANDHAAVAPAARCYVPLIKEQAALMHMLHIGAQRRALTRIPRCLQAHRDDMAIPCVSSGRSSRRNE